jgi:hypothetical protein
VAQIILKKLFESGNEESVTGKFLNLEAGSPGGGFELGKRELLVPEIRSLIGICISWLETRSAPAVARCYLAVLPSISEIPFLDCWIPD